jgi:hypothetical protein
VAIKKNATADTTSGGSWSTISAVTVANGDLPTGTASADWYTVSFSVAIPADGTANGLSIGFEEGAQTPNGAYFEVAQVQLCAGSVALPFQPKSFAEELRDCQRYYEKSYDYATAPGTSTANGAVYVDSNGGPYCILGNVRYKVEKRIAITPTTYSQTGAVGKIRNVTAGSDLTAAIAGGGANGFSIFVNNAASTALDDLSAHWTADAEL